jgi:Protein of unknown function (DUF2934)
MNGKRDDRIRSRAYGIWEREGRPQGRHEHHWHQASREVEGEASDDQLAAQPSGDEAGSEQPRSNADARLSGNDSATPAASAPGGKTAARAKRPGTSKARAKAPAKPKA